jgi:ribosome maturation factor RimP
MEILQTEITQLLSDEGVVLLEMNSVMRNRGMQIRIIGDRRESGFTIDDCARLSHEIRNLITEKNLIDGDFSLEVSSPGLDYPLSEPWQFKKNLGRLLKIRIPGEKGPKEINGRLKEVNADGIILTVDKKEINPEFNELLSAKVLPEFKSPHTESKP